MPDAFTFWSIVLAVLAAFLYLSVGFRHLSRAARRRAAGRANPSRAFNASAIAPELRRIRRDHAAAARSRPRDASYRADLLAAARRMIADLSYFHAARNRAEPQSREH
jgi:hypothetical protein